MSEEATKPILKQYDRDAELYGSFTRTIESLVREMLREAAVRAYTVTSRVKSRESLRGKLLKRSSAYSDLTDITDIAGVRITTYFADDVDRVAEYVEREFNVDTKNSVDRRAVIDPETFGYLSLHHIVSLGADRAALLEYRRFADLKVEIQTRSVLQHAWAEIEHDLGYKTRAGVPRGIRRRFSALAGLLEIADREFQSLRDELVKYEREVPERIEKEPQLVEIDKASLLALMDDSQTLAEADEALASSLNTSMNEWNVTNDDFLAELRADFIERVVALLKVVQVSTIQDLETKLRRYKEIIGPFAYEFTKHHQGTSRAIRTVLRGLSVFYLAHVLAGQTKSVEDVRRFLEAKAPLPSDVSVEDEAQRIIDIYKRVEANSR